jgi:glycylpeptide N-tetradecanoyltransferase
MKSEPNVSEEQDPNKDALTKEKEGPPLRFLEKLRDSVQRLSLQERSDKSSTSTQHRFWNTQPVPRYDEILNVEHNDAIEANKPLEHIRQQPYALPEGFQWSCIDVNSREDIEELYQLLAENYVEDDEAMFRFNYSIEFLQWALKVPGSLPEWHLGVRSVSSGKLMGFIASTPAHIIINRHEKRMVEINFLCIHKKLRSRRLAPVLIREITRRVHLVGIFQAAYTSGSLLPRPFTECRYYHRSLNLKKLVECRFAPIPKNTSLAKMIKEFRLPDRPQLAGLRSFRVDDVDQVVTKLNTYLRQHFKIHPEFSREECLHYFTPIPNVLYSYVVEDPSNGDIRAFASFYCLPSAVLRLQTHHHSTLKIAYLLYYFVVSEPHEDHRRLVELMFDLLVLAKNEEFDVFNCLTVMENESFIEPLKFGRGDGVLRYYLYNWKCAVIEPKHVGLVLL